MAKLHATTNERGHQKMTEETNTVAKGEDPATIITTALIAK
jgi:hypothetical protein